MTHFLYISDVFCPWCYGFAPVMHRLAAEHPEWPVRVLCGSLVEEPTTLQTMAAKSPTLRAFFERLAATTGQAVGEPFLRRLEPGEEDAPLFSPEMATVLAAVNKLKPGCALETMEAFQTAFYRDGINVLYPPVQPGVAGVDPDALTHVLHDPAIMAEAERESEEALELLGDFVVYPTLWLVDGEDRLLLSRGYSRYEAVASRLAARRAGEASADACGLDGACPL
ncbi:MAG TPA: hypothetical protein H9874_06375 [Candidatus Bilophila faecipullorum]|uniref:DSBA-like thioredoxin domain-containing protein n=2 Tax=Bilophila TaxID=35832 RepID=A0A9D1R0F1_9BACT|nr:hypothetical protein [uncultured Bilophila sp.]HIW78752.1 hypothetical protein [Candidatus Bilophila faecipullorum]